MQRVSDLTTESSCTCSEKMWKPTKWEGFLEMRSRRRLRSHVAVVMTLVHNGANVNQRGGFFGSAINAACFAGNLEIVEFLINSGANVEYKGTLGSPLDALRKSEIPNRAIVVRLLQNGALSFASQITKSWAMNWVAISGYEDIIQLLIDTMPIIEKTSFGWTVSPPEFNHQSYQPKVSAPYQAVLKGHETVFKLLVEKWININEADMGGRTSLYWACFFKCHGIVKILLHHGADIHRAGPNDWKARYWATLFNDQETLRLLNWVCDPSSCERCADAEIMAKAENEAISASALDNMALDEKANR
ncbi:MAG: hypothetical protein Q9191_006788 [Dirinaria sp. TL-2023a]